MTRPTNLSAIIDAHVNLASHLAVPRRFITEQAENIRNRLTAHGQRIGREQVLGRIMALYQDHDADRLVAEMDAGGVDQAMLVAPDFSMVEECELDREEVAQLHHRVCTRHPGRFGVFWGVDPRSPERGVAHFESCVRRFGFQGLKIYPINGYSPSDARLYPYYEVCAARGLPVLSHTGPGYQALDFAFGDPSLIDRAARDFPSVNFILGHGGARTSEQALHLCAHRPNVYLDIAGFIGGLAPGGYRDHLHRLFHLGLNHKIIFGSDWSAYRASHTVGGIVADFRTSATVFAGVKKTHQRLIMGATISRLLGADRAGAR